MYTCFQTLAKRQTHIVNATFKIQLHAVASPVYGSEWGRNKRLIYWVYPRKICINYTSRSDEKIV